MNTVTLVAERRGRILGFYTPPWRRLRPGSCFSPSFRSTAAGDRYGLHQELKAHIPRIVPFVGRYALLDSPVLPFLEKIGYIPGKQYLWFDRYA
jgi:hypothetical protein